MKSVILFVVPSLMAIANTQKVENHLASLSRIGNAVAYQRATGKFFEDTIKVYLHSI
jgi:hypothetical protein